MIVEVFKTNINRRSQANKLLEAIHKTFHNHKANFDLEDCDRILRVQCDEGILCTKTLTAFLSDMGCKAEILQG